MKILKQNNKSFFRKSSCSVLILCIAMLISCDKGFKDMNTDPNAYLDPLIGNLWSHTIIRTAGVDDRNTQYPHDKLGGAMMQWWASLNAYQWTGDKYLHKLDYSEGLYLVVYDTELKGTQHLINLTKDDPDLSNHYNILRIFRVYIMHRCTDFYGDVPYFEAGQGDLGILKPKFDRQEDIYKDMLKELEEAANNLDPSKPSWGAADYIYKGDVTQWKKWAYSLMLRLGLRCTKVDLALAETWVKKAIAGGVMTGTDDIPYLEHTSGTGLNYNQHTYRFARGEVVPPGQQGRGYGKMGETFVTMLRDTRDPRLPFYITLWPGNQSNASAATIAESTKHEVQKGLPHGYDANSILALYPNWDNNTYQEFSEVNLQRIGREDAPTIFQHYSEVELYLAEAALRGWTNGTTPKEHYEKGVRASMSYMSLFPSAMTYRIPVSEVDDYFVRYPYQETSDGATFDEQMEQIHTQLWLAIFLDGIEEFANWRRVEYPKLTPTNYPGNQTGGTIPRRLPYPLREEARNKENYDEAIRNQGLNLWTTRVWWDKE